jgi:hypothetical protein
MAGLRNTLRKGIITEVWAEVFGEGPVLLDELRWAVFSKELRERGASSDEMPRAYKVSFVRTIRNHMPGRVLHSLPRPDRLPTGLVARAAVYRIRRSPDLVRFTRSPDAYICFRLAGRKKIRVDFALCIGKPPGPETTGYDAFHWPEEGVGEKSFPVSSGLSIVANDLPDTDQLLQMAAIGWPLYRTTSNLRAVEASPLDPPRAGYVAK